MSKLKVLIVCHFSNAAVREKLPLDNRKLYGYIRSLFGLPKKEGGYVDLASWDTNLIDNLSKREDVDLYVISAHSGLKRARVHFTINDVKYWFIRCDFATMSKHLIGSPSLWHALNPMRPRVRHIARQVNPDIIALVGAENPHISGTVVGLEQEYPVIVKAQTIYNNPQRSLMDSFDKKNGYVERLLFERMKYFSVTTRTHCALFRKFNPTAFNIKWFFATTYPEVKPMIKEFDFVNFAMNMSPKKGYHDALRALAIVKKEFPNVRMNLVGGGTKDELDAISYLVTELGLRDNVVLTPLFPKQEDLFQHIQKARFALLPCKLDHVSSTIRQAMHYGLPVICYKTEGTVRLNDGGEKVLIAENGNYEDLASKMLVFLREPEIAERLGTAASVDSNLKNDNKKITEQIVSGLKAVVANFKNGTPVPPELLYDQV